MLSGVDKSARETGAKMDIIRATGPLETFRWSSAHRPVASAIVQFTRRTSPGQSVRHAGSRYGVHEGRLSSPFMW